jgi:hypothetical protein
VDAWRAPTQEDGIDLVLSGATPTMKKFSF